MGLEGFMEMRISLLTLGCAVALLWPAPWWVHLAGLLTLTGIFALNWRDSRRIPTGLRQAQNLNNPHALTGTTKHESDE